MSSSTLRSSAGEVSFFSFVMMQTTMMTLKIQVQIL